MANKHIKPIVSGLILGLVLLTGIIIWYFSSTQKASEVFYTVEKGAIVEEVKSTGTVNAADSVDLSFEKSGRIVYVGAEVGDEVPAGKILASLDASDISAELAQANANVDAQAAKLNELEQGARPEQIQIQETNIDAAKSQLDQAIKVVITQINNAYVSGDSAIHTSADSMFRNPRSPNPALLVTVDPSLKIALESSRIAIEATLTSWSQSLAPLSSLDASSTIDQVSGYISEAENNLTSISDFLGKLATAANSLTPDSHTSQSIIDGYKASISGARLAISGSMTAVVSAESGYKGALSTLSLANNQLTLQQAGGVIDDIKAQQAQVDQAKASVQNLQSQLYKTAVRAPFSGKVIRQDAKVGQISTPNIPVISLISDKNFQVETYVPEIDVAKIKVNDPATVTLDAYGNGVVFGASVIKIDPAGTVLNGVPSYKVTLQFNQNDDRIKTAMTANVSIHSASDNNALIIPVQSVITEDDQSYVLLGGKGGQPTLQKIETGRESGKGMIEVLSGLQEGDQIVSFSNSQK